MSKTLLLGWILLWLTLGTAEAATKITYFHNDALGSPVAATDENGGLLWQEHYYPFGERMDYDPNAEDTTTWYTGHKEDTSTGFLYMGARYYDPIIGRFTAADPVEVNPENVHSFNRYAYANNNPYRYVDPDGNSPIDFVFLAYDVGKLGVALYTGQNIGGALLDVGSSVVGAFSPIPGTGEAIKLARAADKASDLASVAKGTGNTVKEGIYEFTDTAGKKYCGQSCNVPSRLQQHVNSGKLDPSQSVTTTEVLGGKTAREIAEHKRIQEITGGVPARFSDKVSNKVDPIGSNRRHLLDD